MVEARRRSTHSEAGSILVELALSMTLLVTILGGAVDITREIIRYGELVEVVKTTTKMASILTVDSSDNSMWLEEAGEQAMFNARNYLVEKGFDPERYSVQFVAKSEMLEESSKTTALVTVAIKHKTEFMLLPLDFLFDTCVKSTYLWENGAGMSPGLEYKSDPDSTISCV